MSARLFRVLPLIALAVGSGLIVVLARQNGDLRAEAALQRRRAIYPRAGQYVPSHRVATMGGDSVTLGAGPRGEKQILLFFESKCGFCKADAPTWNDVALRIARTPYDSIRVFGVSVDTSNLAASRYAVDHAFAFPVVRLASTRWISLFRAPAVPTIMLIDSDGKILFARSGELGKRAGVDSLLALIAAKPGSRPAAVAASLGGSIPE